MKAFIVVMVRTTMKKHVVLLLTPLLFLATVGGQPGLYCNDSTLEFLFMTSFGAAFNSSGSAVGAMMAVDRINSNDTILPDYQVVFDEVIDTEVKSLGAGGCNTKVHCCKVIIFTLYYNVCIYNIMCVCT